MDDEMKALVKQYIDRRKHQRQDLVKELGISEVEADQAVSTLELYFDIEASEEQGPGLDGGQTRFSGRRRTHRDTAG
jgi:hypothetical protein